MSAIPAHIPNFPPRSNHIIDLTSKAYGIAREATAMSADCLATGSELLLESLREHTAELDLLDFEIHSGVTAFIHAGNEAGIQELFTCIKLAVGLKRIGKLLSSVGADVRVHGPIEPRDSRDLVLMATILEKMLTDLERAFCLHDLAKTVEVLQSEPEMERARRRISARHLDGSEDIRYRANMQILSMAQSLERAGHCAKTLAEEICRFVTGNTVRQGLITHDKPVEQVFLKWLQRRSGNLRRPELEHVSTRNVRLQLGPMSQAERGIAR